MALASAENIEAPFGSLEERFRPGQTVPSTSVPSF